MIKLTKIYTRPNTIVPFFDAQAVMSDEWKTHWRDNFKIPGKIVSTDNTLSADGLQLTNVAIWLSEAALNEFKNDTLASQIVTAKDNHNAQHGITEENTKEEI